MNPPVAAAPLEVRNSAGVPMPRYGVQEGCGWNGRQKNTHWSSRSALPTVMRARRMPLRRRRENTARPLSDQDAGVVCTNPLRDEPSPWLLAPSNVSGWLGW